MKIGDILSGTIVGVKPYGAFIELANGETGLIHISEIKSGYIDNINKVLELRQTVQVQVIDIDEYSQKPSLSMRTLTSENHNMTGFHRFSKARYKIGFKSIKQSMETWVKEGKAYLQGLNHQ